MSAKQLNRDAWVVALLLLLGVSLTSINAEEAKHDDKAQPAAGDAAGARPAAPTTVRSPEEIEKDAFGQWLKAVENLGPSFSCQKSVEKFIDALTHGYAFFKAVVDAKKSAAEKAHLDAQISKHSTELKISDPNIPKRLQGIMDALVQSQPRLDYHNRHAQDGNSPDDYSGAGAVAALSEDKGLSPEAREIFKCVYLYKKSKDPIQTALSKFSSVSDPNLTRLLENAYDKSDGSAPEEASWSLLQVLSSIPTQKRGDALKELVDAQKKIISEINANKTETDKLGKDDPARAKLQKQLTILGEQFGRARLITQLLQHAGNPDGLPQEDFGNTNEAKMAHQAVHALLTGVKKLFDSEKKSFTKCIDVLEKADTENKSSEESMACRDSMKKYDNTALVWARRMLKDGTPEEKALAQRTIDVLSEKDALDSKRRVIRLADEEPIEAGTTPAAPKAVAYVAGKDGTLEKTLDALYGKPGHRAIERINFANAGTDIQVPHLVALDASGTSFTQAATPFVPTSVAKSERAQRGVTGTNPPKNAADATSPGANAARAEGSPNSSSNPGAGTASTGSTAPNPQGGTASAQFVSKVEDIDKATAKAIYPPWGDGAYSKPLADTNGLKKDARTYWEANRVKAIAKIKAPGDLPPIENFSNIMGAKLVTDQTLNDGFEISLHEILEGLSKPRHSGSALNILPNALRKLEVMQAYGIISKELADRMRTELPIDEYRKAIRDAYGIPEPAKPAAVGSTGADGKPATSPAVPKT